MKILFLALDIDLNSAAGDTIHTKSIARAFARKGHQILLLAGAGSCRSEEMHGVEVKVIRKRFPRFLRFLDDLHAVFIGFKYLFLAKGRAIYERRFSCKIGLALKYLTSSRLGVEINGLVDEEAEMISGKKIKSRGSLLKYADFIVPVAPLLGKRLTEKYNVPENKIKVIENGVETEIFYPGNNIESRKELKIESPDKIILFVGNLVNWYDFKTLIHALKILNDKRINFHMIILGGGALMEHIKNLVADCKLERSVTLIGKVQHKLVPMYINASDICVAPFTIEVNSNIDLSPLKLFEYLACGKPVISSNLGGMNRYLSEFSLLYLVEPENEIALAEKISELLTTEQKENHECSKYVRENYSWDKTAEKILNIYKINDKECNNKL